MCSRRRHRKTQPDVRDDVTDSSESENESRRYTLTSPFRRGSGISGEGVRGLHTMSANTFGQRDPAEGGTSEGVAPDDASQRTSSVSSVRSASDTSGAMSYRVMSQKGSPVHREPGTATRSMLFDTMGAAATLTALSAMGSQRHDASSLGASWSQNRRRFPSPMSSPTATASPGASPSPRASPRSVASGSGPGAARPRTPSGSPTSSRAKSRSPGSLVDGRDRTWSRPSDGAGRGRRRRGEGHSPDWSPRSHSRSPASAVSKPSSFRSAASKNKEKSVRWLDIS